MPEQASACEPSRTAQKLEARARLESAVIDIMSEAAAAPMQWGRDDCALWAVEPLRRALDVDAAEDLRGRYRTRKGAQRVLGKGGLASAMRAAARRHCWIRIAAGEARPGDLGLVAIDGGFAMAVCRAPGWFVARNESGFTAVRSGTVRFSWAVMPGSPNAMQNIVAEESEGAASGAKSN